jgi:hypothetical protein
MAHQGDRRGFNGDIAAAAHGDPDIRLGQRRGIVDAVADHRHLTPLALQRLMASALPSGSTPAITSSMPASLAMALAVVGLSPVSITRR